MIFDKKTIEKCLLLTGPSVSDSMKQAEPKKATLKGNDIIFECSQCGKGLVIDFRGVGLNIQCPQCDSELEVPIPEGFDLAELDKKISSNEMLGEDEQTAAPAPSIAVAPDSTDVTGQINALKTELEALRAQQQYFAQQHADMLNIIKTVNRQVGEFRKTLDELGQMLDTMTGPEADETQKLG